MTCCSFLHLSSVNVCFCQNQLPSRLSRNVLAAFGLLLLLSAELSAQSIAPPFAADLTLTNIGSSFFQGGGRQSRTTQMAWTDGPTETTSYLYLSSNERGIRRLTYDTATSSFVNGSLEDVATDIRGLGIAFHGDTLYASEPYVSSADNSVELSRLWRIEDKIGRAHV